jgi:hypothetical protein
MNDLVPVSFFVLVLVFTPLLALAHELGHALVGLARTDGLVAVEVGRKPPLWRGRVGRLALALNPIPALSDVGGHALTYAVMPARDRLAYALAGPAAHAAASLALLLAGLDLHSRALIILGVLSLVTAASNLIPRKTRSGLRTDGAIAVSAARDLRTERRRTARDPASASFMSEFDATVARWFVLFSDTSAADGNRALILGGAPVALGHSPDDRGPKSLALWKLALVGWCWREAERGDPQRLRDAALDAVHRATLSGAVEPQLTALAARFLATSDVELGLASPGTNDETRIRFLTTAFERAPANLRPGFVPKEEQLFAFRYGVALHDVERARAL